MSEVAKKIGYAMSLRTPQKEALSYLAAISENCDYRRDDKVTIEAVASEHCENQNQIKIADEFNFPSFCYHMATGIGKTRLMGACIYYLYKTKGYKHFFILAPGNTIYEKLRKEANPSHPKYIFKGLESEMGRPRVFDGENYTSYPARYVQGEIELEKTSEIQLFIFNIGKIFNSKTDTQFKFHKFHEDLGMSFADVLAQFDDLVICMDEAHRYYAPASMKAINYLKPILGLEFTATPKTTGNVIYSYDLARGAVEGYLKTPVVMGRSNMAGYSADDVEEMKIRDGLTLHEHRKAVLRQYCNEHGLAFVKPIVLVACKDTNHAKKIRELIDNDTFESGRYKGKVIEIHSNMRGEETEENVRRLLSIERNDNPAEIVLHVYKLKEGWDVNNLFTIIPLNAAKSDILAMQTIGRGLRLPFGQATGNEEIDTLDIIAHEHYRELVDEIKNSDIFRYRDLDKGKNERWLPAVEINGEGIFIEFNQTTIKEWLNLTEVRAFSQRYAESYKEFCASREWNVTVLRNAVYVLLHTFSHLLIKQMSMSSGYSSSAIRERIYFGDNMAGILLYTGSPDKEGSLGGLVERGSVKKMVPIMRDAFQEALLCTNDPECLHNAPAAANSNGAACHSCCMISETACENGNRMLDRGLVVPIAERENNAFFKELVEDLCQLEM